MSSDTEPLASGQTTAATTVAANAIVDMDMTNDDANVPHNSVEVPSTPLGAAHGSSSGVEITIPASQETILSTEGPGSPMDADESFRTELNDNDDEDIDIDVDTELPRSIIPSSLTPPPSSQLRQTLPSSQRHLPSQQRQQLSANGIRVHASMSQRSAIPSPPGTGLSAVAQARRDAAATATALGLGPATSHASTAAVASAAAAAGAACSSPLLGGASDFVPPTPAQIVDASPDELRAMLQASLAEHTRLKTETAHHKLQHNLLTMQADEDAKRAAVEHEMTRREVEALRAVDSARQARRELSTSTATETSQAKYRQLKTWYDEVAEENESLQKRIKLAKRVIQQKEEEMAGLVDEKELLLNRLRENREHFHLLCSPGGLFHGAMTPKPHGSPVHTRATPYQTPKRGSGGGKLGTIQGTPTAAAADSSTTNDASAEPFAALLQALNQENNSAPNTPLTGHRAPPRHIAKHVRNVQSMSSLPTTPPSRTRGSDYAAGLLPSVDLVPQTEPAHRFSSAHGPHDHHGHGHGHSHSVSHTHSQSFTTSASGRYFPETPTRPRHRLPGGRRSRESTISVDEDAQHGHSHSHSHSRSRSHGHSHSASVGNILTDNEDIARQALESVARSGGPTSLSSHSFPPPAFSLSSSAPGRRPLERSASNNTSTTDERIFESQASQAASAMLRRDARESFEVAAAREASRDASAPSSSAASATTTDKAAKLQAKLFGGLNKAGSGAGAADKRKFSGGMSQTSQSGSDHGGADAQKHDSHHMQASPTKKVRIVPSLRDNGDSYRHHHSYQHPDQDRVGLGIRYD
ncbi:hypothetical protein SCUCBS95973_008681 [Sporothrix curviconia]|uniref:FAD-dependent oxidoreductase-like enzyme n=1 Tax=Sporothrix curviconia TaxID=1260050 RepID=A0ABP0CNI9_9PEZI